MMETFIAVFLANLAAAVVILVGYCVFVYGHANGVF